MVKRRKYNILILIVLATLLAITITFLITPVYRATTTLLIESNQPKLTSIEDIYGLETRDKQYFLTQLELFKSRQLAEKVIHQFNLDRNPEFVGRLKDSSAPTSWLRHVLGEDEKTSGHALDRAVEAFEKQLSVHLVKDTQIVKVSFESESSVLAADIPNALATAYIQEQLNSRIQLTKKATGWLEQRLKILKINLDNSEAALQSYMDANNLVDVKGGVNTLTANELHELMLQMVDVKTKYAELIKRYGYMHPKIIAARAELRTAEKNLARGKARIQSIGRKGARLSELQREVQSNKKLYDTFLSRLKEASQAVELHTLNARISDPAVAPIKPVKPRKILIISAVFMASSMLGVFMVLLLELMDRTFKSRDEVEDVLGIPLLASIPSMKATKNSHANQQMLAVLDKKNNAFIEAIRSLRTELKLYGLDHPCNIILVTSSKEGEGKTIIASNLAAAMGTMEKVLLIDANMRQTDAQHNPGISGQQQGLSEVLVEAVDLNTCIQHMDDAGFDLLPCGRHASSDHMVNLLDTCTEDYDRIILDTPSLQDVSDAVLLSRYAKAVLYVIESGTTEQKEAQAGVTRLQGHHAYLVGAVLNKV